MLIYEGNLQKKIGVISQLGAEKFTFPPKPDEHTEGRTDICFYRVALLLKRSTKMKTPRLQNKEVSEESHCVIFSNTINLTSRGYIT